MALARELGRATARVAVVFDGDADGCSAGAITCAMLERIGASPFPLAAPKGEDVYGPSLARAVAQADVAAAVVVDTGARGDLALGCPTVIVDHHAIERRPGCTAYVGPEGDGGATSSSLLAYDLAARVAPMADRAWLAAVGLAGDLGSRAPAHPRWAALAAGSSATALRDVVALVNAAGRASQPEPRHGLAALRGAGSARELLASTSPHVAALRAAREEVSASLARARKVAPRRLGDWSVIVLDEPCRVHGPVAASWSARLAPSIVLVANVGWVPGRVHFVLRCAENVDLRAALREAMLAADLGPHVAAGHRQATGGIVAPDVFARLLTALAENAARPATPSPHRVRPGTGTRSSRARPAPRD